MFGTTNFLLKFIPSVSKIITPLREITHENVVFSLRKAQEDSFNNVKEFLTKGPVSKVFSANEIVLQCDSLKYGLGSCLIQKVVFCHLSHVV